jgi:hypothetical protein
MSDNTRITRAQLAWLTQRSRATSTKKPSASTAAARARSKPRAGTAKKKSTKPVAADTAKVLAPAQAAQAPQTAVPPPSHVSSPPAELPAAAAAAAASVAPAARKREPRLTDLAEYDGAAGEKLDTWLDSLQRCADYHEQTNADAVRFAVARLRETAYAWWGTLDSAAKTAVHSGGVAALAVALRARFQPVTTERVARGQLDKLAQGSRHVNEYISDFNKLHARIPSMSEADSLYAFERGLRADIAMELRKQRVHTLREATEMAAHMGGVAGAPQATHKSSLNHVGLDGEEPSLEERVTKAVLNAMQARDNSGTGSQSQPHRGYTQERQRGGSRGGSRGGRGGRDRPPRGPPVVPGVPEEVVRRRLEAHQCVRCGEDGHHSPACPNAISALGN